MFFGNASISKSKCINIEISISTNALWKCINILISALKMQDKDGFVTKNEFLAISSKITPAQVGTFFKIFKKKLKI